MHRDYNDLINLDESFIHIQNFHPFSILKPTFHLNAICHIVKDSKIHAKALLNKRDHVHEEFG